MYARSLRPLLAALAFAGLLAAAQRHDSLAAIGQIRPKMRLPVTPAGVLEVREFSGDMAIWRAERVVNQPELFHFRWKSQRDDALSATWRVTVGSLAGAVLASGPAGQAPASGAFRFFVADLKAILPATPPSTPRDYWVVLDIDLEGGGRLPSTSVKLTYRRASTSTTVFTDEGLDQPLDPVVESVRNSFDLPAMGGAVIRKNGWMKIGVSGIRRQGYHTRVRPADKWHLGSNTKAMTATLAAVLVDRKVIGWQTTLGQTFPELGPVMNPQYRDITLLQLLRHRGAMPATLGDYENDVLDHRDITNTTRRYLLMKTIATSTPGHAPGKWVYSNAGYIVAAAMLERRAGRSWEDMMRTELFVPLGMQTAGFGPPETEVGRVAPGAPLIPQQPWGHRTTMEVWNGNRVPAAAPAGDVHASLRDWGRFALLHLNGSHGKLQLSKSSLTQLHTPEVDYNAQNPSASLSYACGWGRAYPDDGTMAHDGCNTYWYARVYVHMAAGYAVLVTTNLAGPGSECTAPIKAVDALTARLKAYLGN